MKRDRLSIFIFFFVAFAASAQAKTVSLEEAIGKNIHRIQITKLPKTKPFIIRRELPFQEGDRVTRALHGRALERLRDLQIFARADIEYDQTREEKSNSMVTVRIELEDRWTTIPFFQAQVGGGVSSFRAGIFDVNVLGRLLEMGVQYEELDGTPSATFWFQNPRLFDKRLRVGIDLWTVVRNRDLRKESGEIEGAFTLDRIRSHLFASHEIHYYFTLGLGLDLLWDQVSQDKISDGRRLLNETNQLSPFSRQKTRTVELFANLGRLHYDIYLVRGYRSSWSLKQGAPFLGSETNFYELSIMNKAFWLLPWDANFGAHLHVRQVSTDDLQHQNYLGGFSSVRGYRANQFRGRAAMQANVEYRIPSLKTPWIILQHIVFFDATRVGNRINQLLFGTKNHFFYSVGTGVRIISPKIFSFNGRLDAGYGFGPGGGWGISFGTQQFF